MVKTLSTKQHETLIKFITVKRLEAGLTQAELAKTFGQYQSFVARLESGQRRIDVIEFIHFAHVLKFDACEVIKVLEQMPIYV